MKVNFGYTNNSWVTPAIAIVKENNCISIGIIILCFAVYIEFKCEK